MTRKTPLSAAAMAPGEIRAKPNEPHGLSKRRKPEPGLYLVATPIGNLRDITLRALDILASADLVACEDSRVTRKLLVAHGIPRSLTTYHEHNAERVRPRLIQALENGKSVVLVSDAGTPLVSDPGYKLVRAAQAAGHTVTAVPGASAVLAALSLSGLPSGRFLFAGFLPPKAGPRRAALSELAPVATTLIFFESSRRLSATLSAMAEVLGDRPAALARELTKRFEEVRRGSLHELAAQVAAEGPPKGEVCLVVAGCQTGSDVRSDELDARLVAALARSSLRDAVATVTAETGLPRKRVYARALQLSQGGEEAAPRAAGEE